MNTDDLMRFVREAQPKFEVRLDYDADSDCLFAYMRDVEYFGRRVDDIVTIYEGVEDREMCGCVIKGVRSLLKKWGPFGIDLKGRRIRASLVIMAYVEQKPEIIDEFEPDQFRQLVETAREKEFVLN